MLQDRPLIVGIVQARMTSSRLPGKVLKRVLDKPLLEYELERLSRVREMDGLVVATTVNREDDPVVALCDSLGVRSYRGSEDDVLSRYYEAAKGYGAKVVVRFTADCPLIDPNFVSSLIREFLARREELDYLGTDYSRMPRGTDAEAFSFSALERAWREGKGPLDREHVTWYIHKNPDRFKTAFHSVGEDMSRYRLTVDTPEDFELVKALLGTLYPDRPFFTLSDAVSFLDEHPSVFMLNSDIRQKTT